MCFTRLRIGQRVVALDDQACGRVALRLAREDEDSPATAYLVRWELGGESRRTRAELQPLGRPARAQPTQARR